MFAYLLKCLTILLALWIAHYLRWLPWSELVNIGVTVVVPAVLIVIGMWRAEQRGKDTALSATEARSRARAIQ